MTSSDGTSGSLRPIRLTSKPAISKRSRARVNRIPSTLMRPAEWIRPDAWSATLTGSATCSLPQAATPIASSAATAGAVRLTDILAVGRVAGARVVAVGIAVEVALGTACVEALLAALGLALRHPLRLARALAARVALGLAARSAES